MFEIKKVENVEATARRWYVDAAAAGISWIGVAIMACAVFGC